MVKKIKEEPEDDVNDYKSALNTQGRQEQTISRAQRSENRSLLRENEVYKLDLQQAIAASNVGIKQEKPDDFEEAQPSNCPPTNEEEFIQQKEKKSKKRKPAKIVKKEVAFFVKEEVPDEFETEKDLENKNKTMADKELGKLKISPTTKNFDTEEIKRNQEKFNEEIAAACAEQNRQLTRRSARIGLKNGWTPGSSDEEKKETKKREDKCRIKKETNSDTEMEMIEDREMEEEETRNRNSMNVSNHPGPRPISEEDMRRQMEINGRIERDRQLAEKIQEQEMMRINAYSQSTRASHSSQGRFYGPPSSHRDDRLEDESAVESNEPGTSGLIGWNNHQVDAGRRYQGSYSRAASARTTPNNVFAANYGINRGVRRPRGEQAPVTNSTFSQPSTSSQSHSLQVLTSSYSQLQIDNALENENAMERKEPVPVEPLNLASHTNPTSSMFNQGVVSTAPSGTSSMETVSRSRPTKRSYRVRGKPAGDPDSSDESSSSNSSTSRSPSPRSPKSPSIPSPTPSPLPFQPPSESPPSLPSTGTSQGPSHLQTSHFDDGMEVIEFDNASEPQSANEDVDGDFNRESEENFDSDNGNVEMREDFPQDNAMNQSQRRKEQNRDSNPTSIHNTPSQETRPEGDQQDQGMSSTSSKRRNTNNSQCASLPLSDKSAVAKSSEALDSDDDSDDDDGMSSTGDLSENTKRPRTPRGRYSPDAQRRTNSRLTMSALSIDTQRNTDLNADGSGPSSSGVPSHVQSTSDADRITMSQRRKGASSGIRPRKTISPSLANSAEEEEEEDYSDSQEEDMEDSPVVIDDLTYQITDRAKKFFATAKSQVAEEWHFEPKYLAEVYGLLNEGEQARLPEKMHFGKYVMRTWYGSPFPAEYIKVKMLFVCEFCMFYARSDEIMQNHAKKCEMRAPPGIEIYRKDNVSVFEVDGRKQKSYCQTLCLVSRMFLESKTVFYDTEPFFFYVVTMNDEYGCHFAGYFSKEKYEPDVNNLSCIMTLPCYQEQGFGRFLIDISYALSRKEEWNGGPEQPLSDLGRKAYGGYWRTAVSMSLAHFKTNIEHGNGVSINMIANHTGINSHDVIEVIGALGWAKPINTGEKICEFEWDVDWDMVDMIKREAKASKKIQFHEDCLDWQPRKMKPSMDGYQELTKEEIEEDEIKRKNALQQTPVHNDESMELATPTSSSAPVGSVKKELRSRGHNRNTGRNLKLELTKIKVPEPVEGKEATGEEDEKKKLQKKIRKSLSRCSESVPLKASHREETPDDDEPGPSTKPIGRRPRRTEEVMGSSTPSTSSHGPKTPSSGKGRHRTRTNGEKYENTDDATDTDPATSDEDDDDKPFGTSKGKNGKVHRGRKGGRRKKSVAGKKFPPSFCFRPITEQEDEKKNGVDVKPGPSDVEEKMEGIEKQKADEPAKESNAENTDAEKTAASDMEDTHDYSHLHPPEEEVAKDYNIGTPESYHSSPPLSPEPQMIPGQPNFSVDEDDDNQFEENDIAPPLLVSEVHHQSATESTEPMDQGTSDAPPLIADNDGYSTGDDDAPPRLSPQYKSEDMEEMTMLPQETTHAETEVVAPATAPPPLVQQQLSQAETSYEEPRSYHDPMSAGPSSSIHVTPQMNQMPSSQQNMMTPTPQQQYSQPNSHQQATPGSGGIPSCGPVYNHSTPEQQNQQFMSPQMAGMPASVSSVHSVHNNNSMEMVGGPASLQHTPQQPYDIGHTMGQMPQENGQQMVNNAQTIEQQNQIMMQQHGFNSPPMPQGPLQQQQQQQMPQPIPQQPVPQPPQVAPIVPAPAATNGRRRSETAGATQRKQRQRNTPATAAVQQVVPPQMGYAGMHMMPHMPMPGYPFPYAAYPGYPQMENRLYTYNNPYYPHMFNPMQQMDQAAYQWQMTFNNQQMQDGNGAAAAGAPNYPFPPAATPMNYFQNNTR